MKCIKKLSWINCKPCALSRPTFCFPFVLNLIPATEWNKWIVYCIRQVCEAFSPQEVNFLLLAAFTEFILNHVSLAVYSHYHYPKTQVLFFFFFFLLHFVNVRMQQRCLTTPACKCVFDVFLGPWLRVLFLCWCGCKALKRILHTPYAFLAPAR